MLKNDLLKLTSYDAIANCLQTKTLAPWQCTSVLVALENKCAILSHMTGMGKTLMASAIMRLLRNKYKDSKFIFIGTARQRLQTASDFKKCLGFRTSFLTAESSSILKAQRLSFLSSDILYITVECLNQYDIMLALRPYINRFLAIFADEAHLLGNFREANSAWMFNCLVRNFEYRYALTATPLTSTVSQVSDLCYTLDWITFKDPNALKNKLLSGMVLRDAYPSFYLSQERREVGIANDYRISPILVKPTAEQIGATGIDLYKLTRGVGAIPQQKTVTDLIIKLTSEGKKGLVFIHHHEYRKLLTDYWNTREDFFVRYDSIHGLVPKRKSFKIQNDFNSGDLDVLTISIPTSANLDCDYIIMYELTNDIRQVIGRGERGLLPKALEVYILLTENTGEANYYINTIWGRSLFNQESLSKDYQFLIKFGEALDMMGMVDHERLNLRI